MVIKITQPWFAFEEYDERDACPEKDKLFENSEKKMPASHHGP